MAPLEPQAMAEPKYRIVLRSFAVVIACSYFAILAMGLIPQPQLFQQAACEYKGVSCTWQHLDDLPPAGLTSGPRLE
jgi:hypothetical protein